MPFVRRRQGSVLCNGVRVYSVTEWRLQLNCRRHFLCSPSGLIIFFLKFLPGTAEFMVHKGFLQSCYLFQPKNLIQLHSQLGTYFFIGPAGAGEIHDDGAHWPDSMGPSGAVLPDGSGNSLVQRLI